MRRSFIYCCALAAITCLIYYRMIDNYFLSEWGYLLKQAALVERNGYLELFAPMGGVQVRPVTSLYYYFQWRAFKFFSEGYFAVTFFTQILNVILLYTVLQRVQDCFRKSDKNSAISFISAVSFATFYPYHEALYYVPAETLSLFFALCSILFFVRYLRKGSNAAFIFSLAFYALSVFSKENFFLLPCVLATISILYKKVHTAEKLWAPGKVWRECTAYLLLMIVCLMIYFYVGITRGSAEEAMGRQLVPVFRQAENMALFCAEFFKVGSRAMTPEVDMLRNFTGIRSAIVILQWLFQLSLAGVLSGFAAVFFFRRKMMPAPLFKEDTVYMFYISVVWVVSGFLPVTVFFANMSSRWYYVPAGGFCFLLGITVFETAKMFLRMRIRAGTFFFSMGFVCIILLNSIFLYLKESEYDWHSSVVRYLMYKIIDVTSPSHNGTVYLVDMPGYVNRDAVSDLVSIENPLQIIWVAESKLLSEGISDGMENNFFLKYTDNGIRDSTTLYRKRLGF